MAFWQIIAETIIRVKSLCTVCTKNARFLKASYSKDNNTFQSGLIFGREVVILLR